MVVHASEPLRHMVFRNIRWDTFERLLDDMGESHLRVAYDHGKLEFMTISLEHDSYGRWIGDLILFVAMEMKIPLRKGGSTTLKQALLDVGLEPDECFWFKHEKRMRGRKTWNALTDPPPDLAVEIDITTSWLDRLGIYASLKVPEVWRYDGKKLRVLILGADGAYKECEKSAVFPALPMDQFVRFVRRLDDGEETALLREFTAWLRDDVLAKPNGRGRKNGKKHA
ncbi:MAG: Uma2 family endonuclease [Planctomycetes bacterium]|nr:Uma2 family endonuclease [Planctomycetota bacterium]